MQQLGKNPQVANAQAPCFEIALCTPDVPAALARAGDRAHLNCGLRDAAVVVGAVVAAARAEVANSSLDGQTDDTAAEPEATISTPGREAEPAHLRSVVGLVWRYVVLWMLLLALLTLSNLLG